MIHIHYVPPSIPAQLQDEPLAASPFRVPDQRVKPFDGESAQFTTGTRSKLKLDAIGQRGRSRRNQRDSLALSKEWRNLAGQALGASGFVQTLHDATTRLGPNGEPNMPALREAQRQLRQWFFQQASGDKVPSGLQDRVSKVDGLLARLLRCNAPLGEDALGESIPRSSPVKGDNPFKQVLSFLLPQASTAASLHREGMKLWEAGRSEEALPVLEAAADKAPKNVKFQTDLGRLLMEEGYFPEAEWTLMVADALQPRQARAQMALGELYGQMGQPLLAIQAFKLAVQRNPRDTDAHAQLGVAYYEMGDLEGATPHLQKAVQLDQQCVVGRFFLAQISLQENDLLRARFQLGMVAQLSPQMDLSRFNNNSPQALSSQSTPPEVAPLHHWQLPTHKATGPLKNSGTGPLKHTSTTQHLHPPGNSTP